MKQVCTKSVLHFIFRLLQKKWQLIREKRNQSKFFKTFVEKVLFCIAYANIALIGFHLIKSGLNFSMDCEVRSF